MVFTAFGLLVVPLSLFIAILSPRTLFWGFVISLPLGQAVLLRVPVITFELSPALFFMALLLVRRVFDLLLNQRVSIPRSTSLVYLGLFVVAITLSLLMPVLISGKAVAQPVDGPYIPYDPQPISFDRIHLTQSAYVLFWIVSFGVLLREVSLYDRLPRLIRTLAMLGVVVVISGLLNQVLRLIGAEGLAIGMYALLGGGDLSFLGKEIAGIPLMYSIAGEPGWTAHFLLIPFSLVAIPTMLNYSGYLWSRPINTAIGLVLLVGLLVSGGTTGYVGLAVLGVLLLLTLTRRLVPHRYVALLGKLAGLGLIVLLAIAVGFQVMGLPLVSFVEHAYVNELQLMGGSSSVRVHYAVENLRLFAQYPLLGTGYGSSKSSSLITGLLSNVGLLGTLPFLLFVGYLVRRNLRVYLKRQNPDIAAMGLALSVGFLALVVTSLVAKSMGVLITGWFWLFAALATAYPLMISSRTGRRVAPSRERPS